MLKRITVSLIFLLFTVSSFCQNSTNVGITFGTGISNDVNNLGIKFQCVWAYRAGFFLDHQKDNIILSGEVGYIKTGFKDFYYMSLSGSGIVREEYYSINHHKLFSEFGVKLPLNKTNSIYFKPGISIHFLLSYKESKRSNPNHQVGYYKNILDKYNRFQVLAHFELGLNMNRFSVGMQLTPQILSNVTDKDLRVYSYYGGIFLRIPFYYF